MKRYCLMAVLLSSTFVMAQSQLQRGTIVRMQMGECISAQRGFMAALSGAQHASTEEYCPEYVLVADKVVYVIVGKTSTALVPLAETTKFRFQNNELLIRIDDAKHETRFGIKEMVLRSEWEHVHPLVMQEVSAPAPRRADAAGVMEEPQ